MRAVYIDNAEQWMEEFRFSVEVKVRFSETDMYGHLNNTVPFTYFEMARIEYLQSLGLMADWVSPNSETIPVVADLQCDFLQQVFFDERLRIFVKAAKVGSSSVDVHYLAKNEKGVPVFTGRGTIVQINRQTGRAQAWTDHTKKLMLTK
ncbi:MULTISPECIES: thioesterase family protein [Bacillales]|uniref:Thioesterase family protein n=1 Tax=Lysinibacillus louembei TaxID=1470088 RepID=A0ABZ0RV61_9BACI|nr:MULTISPECIES: thioesterase family protein [Bacillales]MCT6924514.1 acyl-CoA thioesterase [Metasolibacillus sp.]MCT6940772.1 acyl-CoA thioesterase [Metasolibacillus sp.]WPK10730.1 thioesterase family protein [Lysinibacillus louembei]